MTQLLIKLAPIALTAIALLSPSVAHAESLAQYLRAAQTDVGKRNIIASAAAAYLMSNASLENSGRELIFCPPRRQDIKVDGYIAILQSYADDRPEILGADEDMLHAYLLVALQNRFPCR